MEIQQFQWASETRWTPGPPGALCTAISAQLVLAFGGAATLDAQRPMLTRTFPKAHLFGCTTAGEIAGARVCDDTLAVTAVAFDETRVAVATAPIPGVDRSFDAGAAVARRSM